MHEQVDAPVDWTRLERELAAAFTPRVWRPNDEQLTVNVGARVSDTIYVLQVARKKVVKK